MLDTVVLPINPETPEHDLLQHAVEVLKRGGLVAFPTETVYGLGADVLEASAVQKVFAAKRRPSDNPLIVHIAHQDQLFDLVDEMPENGAILAQRFWPGPLTLVVKRTFIVPDVVTAGLDTVAVRMPAHPVALRLIAEFNGGIVGPSANLSGRPSPTTARHVLDDLRGTVDCVLDAGPTQIGVESTVLDVTVIPPVLLRRGGLDVRHIESVIGEVQTAADSGRLSRSPGTRHRHYAPRARVIVVEEGDVTSFVHTIQELRQRGKRVGSIVHSQEFSSIERSEFVRALPNSLELVARHLYRMLREMDDLGVDCVVVESVREEGLGSAIMDRLRRAAEIP
jgi:L-threonylcarbamoyladenylate synthase